MVIVIDRPVSAISGVPELEFSTHCYERRIGRLTLVRVPKGEPTAT